MLHAKCPVLLCLTFRACWRPRKLSADHAGAAAALRGSRRVSGAAAAVLVMACRQGAGADALQALVRRCLLPENPIDVAGGPRHAHLLGLRRCVQKEHNG